MTGWPLVTPQDVVRRIDPPDPAPREAARDRQLSLTKPAGALGRLESLSEWLCAVQGQCPPRPVDNVRVIVIAGDHGVARTAGTSAYPPEVTGQMVLNFLAGGAAVNVLARSTGATVRVVDVAVDVEPEFYGESADLVTRYRVRRGSGSIDREDAMSPEEALASFSVGVALADEAADDGVDMVIAGDMGIGNTTAAAVLVGLLASIDPASVVGRGTGIDDTTWMRKCAAVRDAMRRGRPLVGDPLALLAAVGGADLAAVTGLLLGASARRTPVLLDGVITCACGMLAQRMSHDAPTWWAASHRSTEPAASTALDRLGLDPLLDLDLRLGEGTGALLALPLVRAAGDTLREMATFDEAGVSDRDVEPATPLNESGA